MISKDFLGSYYSLEETVHEAGYKKFHRDREAAERYRGSTLTIGTNARMWNLRKDMSHRRH